MVRLGGMLWRGKPLNELDLEERKELHRQMQTDIIDAAQRAQNGARSTHTGAAIASGSTARSRLYITDPLHRQRMLATRLHLMDESIFSICADLGISDLNTMHHGETVYVIVLANSGGEPVILSDPAHLYPSDALMASLSLLRK